MHRLRQASAICAIDWTGAHAYRSIFQQQQPQLQQPLIYLNFRVYSSGISDSDRHSWYDDMERRALDSADRIIALSEGDKANLLALFSSSKTTAVDILLPPLRGDMLKLAEKSSTLDMSQYLPREIKSRTINSKQRRFLLTCVVRQSPEKTVLRFITLVRETKDLLDDLGIVPLLAGSKADQDYVASLKNELLEVAPDSIIVESFLTPNQLAAIFSRTLLNVHPCAYDAYGMTIVEAAAQGAPSVMASNDVIGASALIGSEASLQVGMPKGDERQLDGIDLIRDLLLRPATIDALGVEARKRALAWDEKAYGSRLIEIINETQKNGVSRTHSAA